MVAFKYTCVSCGKPIVGFFGGGDKQLTHARQAAEAAGAVFFRLDDYAVGETICPACQSTENGTFHDIQRRSDEAEAKEKGSGILAMGD